MKIQLRDQKRAGLTAAEAKTLQQVADDCGFPFSVVGERGRNAGRNIETGLPFGAGAHERSPIELSFPSEYDLFTSGRFSSLLYNALDSLLGKGTRGYWQASHLWPPTEQSIDFYPRNASRVVLSARQQTHAGQRQA